MTFKKLLILILLTGVFSEIYGQNAKQHIKAGEQFLQNGMYKAAIEEFDKAILFDPNDGRSYQVKASVQMLMKDSANAAINYRKAAALGYNSEINYYRCAQVFYSSKNIEQAKQCLALGLTEKPKNFELLLLKTTMLYESGDYSEAYITANEAAQVKDQAVAYYYSGLSARKQNQPEQALKDLEKAIIRDKNFVNAYLEIADIQLSLKKFDYAIDNCSLVLLLHNPKNVKALLIRSKAFHGQNESKQAIDDITKAISLEKSNWRLYLQRGRYNMDFALYSNAIDDYTLALKISDTISAAYKNRAFAYEQIDKKAKARADYIKLLSMIRADKDKEVLAEQISAKIFELGRENNKPQLILNQPQISESLELKVNENEDFIELSGIIKEDTEISELKVNTKEVLVTPDGKGKFRFSTKLSTSDLDYVTLSATDVYNNIVTVSYPVLRVESIPPGIILISPSAGANEVIHLEAGDNTLYIEGRINDKSKITDIKVDEVNASFAPGDYNPKFTATIDIRNRKNLTVTAVDAFGNKSAQTYEFLKDGQLLSNNNPMGKTWVVLIENTNYKELSSLNSPTNDVAAIQTSLERYKISKVLHKKDMSKRELEKFFAIDLRDLIISNNVKSLMIWYAGHGKTMNNTGYWIPIDGRVNDEYSFYNINALKASLYSYSSLTHILVVSDACEAGESFTVAMRGDNSLASCDNAELITLKSALVLTSSSKEAAMDNSLFANTFANALSNNPADCIPIDAIAERISLVMYKHTAQKPAFGRISGLEDKSGTFFFISK